MSQLYFEARSLYIALKPLVKSTSKSSLKEAVQSLNEEFAVHSSCQCSFDLQQRQYLSIEVLVSVDVGGFESADACSVMILPRPGSVSSTGDPCLGLDLAVRP